jgi:hypothetical protein
MPDNPARRSRRRSSTRSRPRDSTDTQSPSSAPSTCDDDDSPEHLERWLNPLAILLNRWNELDARGWKSFRSALCIALQRFNCYPLIDWTLGRAAAPRLSEETEGAALRATLHALDRNYEDNPFQPPSTLERRQRDELLTLRRRVAKAAQDRLSSFDPYAPPSGLQLIPGGFAYRCASYDLPGRPRDMLSVLLRSPLRRCAASGLRVRMKIDDSTVNSPEQVVRDTAKNLRKALKQAADAAGVPCGNPLPSTGRGQKLTYILALS